MTHRLRNLVFGGVLLGLVGATVPTRAGVLDHTMYITFSRSVALPGVELAKGTYIFESVNTPNTNSLVRVTNKDRSKVYLMAFTVGCDRPRSMGPNQVVTLGEAAPGKAPRIHAWFPAGESTGRQFIYED